MDRREFLRTSAMAGASLALPSAFRFTSAFAGEATETTAGCLWGAHAEPRGAQTTKTAITDLESEIGRGLAVSRHYVTWDQELPGALVAWSAEQGRTPYVAWHAVRGNGSRVSWSSIASGSEDSWVARQAQSLRAAGYPAYFCFHHEPEDDTANGGSANFVAAYERIRDIFSSEAVANLTWVVSLMRTTYAGGHGGYDSWMPNDFDLMCVDGYNRGGRSWRSFDALFAPARAAALATGRSLMIGEYGTVERSGDAEAKARWFTEAAATMKSWPEVKAAVYSHVYSARYGLAYWVDTSATSLAAFTAAGLDPYFS